MKITISPIGTIRSPFKKIQDIEDWRNINPRGFIGVRGELEVFPEFSAGLKDIDGFSHLWVIFLFHLSKGAALKARPPFDRKERGVFSTRSPRRPNPLGLTAVRLLGRTGSTLKIEDIDMIDGTPVLDLKPYTKRDRRQEIRLGWLEPLIK